jgi:peptide/nickel transport system ATP-binding protein
MNRPVLQVKNLVVEYVKNDVRKILIDDVTFSVFEGEVLGLLGQSGSGKTLISLAVMGLLPRGMSAAGSISLNGKEIVGTPERVLNTIRGSATIVFQEPSSALDPLMKIETQIALPLKKHAALAGNTLKGSALRDAVYALMEEVRLTDIERIARSYPHEISGGQKQRAAIALALACSPALLIADEPTSSTDAQVQKQLVEIISRLAHNRGIAVLFISHDIAVVRSIAHRIIVMKDGTIVEESDADNLVQNPKHKYTKLLIRSARELDRALKKESA